VDTLQVDDAAATANSSMDHDWIFSHVWDAVTEAIDRSEQHRHLSRLVAPAASSSSSSIGEEASAGLGTIEPTTWPGPHHPLLGTAASSPPDSSDASSSQLTRHAAAAAGGGGGIDDDPYTLEAAAPALMEKTALTVKEVRRGSILWMKKAKEGRPQKSRVSISSLINSSTEQAAAAVAAVGQGGGKAMSRREVKSEEEESFV